MSVIFLSCSTLRFAAALNTRPGIWIDLQSNYDLWQAAHKDPTFLEKISKIAAVW